MIGNDGDTAMSVTIVAVGYRARTAPRPGVRTWAARFLFTLMVAAGHLVNSRCHEQTATRRSLGKRRSSARVVDKGKL
jgi:hypothetical protein